MKLNMEATQEMHGYWNGDQQKKIQFFLRPLLTNGQGNKSSSSIVESIKTLNINKNVKKETFPL